METHTKYYSSGKSLYLKISKAFDHYVFTIIQGLEETGGTASDAIIISLDRITVQVAWLVSVASTAYQTKFCL